jgi:hypothetical protein
MGKRGFVFSLFSLAMACATTACLVSGCSSGLRAAEDAPAGIDLSGQWQLAPGVREAERVTLDKAIDTQYAREREARRRWQQEPSGAPTGSPKGTSAGNPNGSPNGDDPYAELQRAAPPPRVEKVRRQLEDIALPAERLKLEQGADMLRFDYFDTKEPRRLRPGATLEVLFLDHDSANVLCGWSGSAFLIETRAEEQLAMAERLELIEHGQKLKHTVKLSGSLTGNVKLESIYERMN